MTAKPAAVRSDMTPDERKQAFDRLFAAIPDEPQGQRVKSAAEWMDVDKNTVRIWSMTVPPRVPSVARLRLLELSLKQRGIKMD